MRLYDIDTFNEIWSTITRNRVRSLLTGFGVFWGVFMLVVLAGLGRGFREGVGNIFGDMNVNSCYFFTNRTTLPYEGQRAGRSWRIKQQDIPIVKTRIPEVLDISAVYNTGWKNRNVVRGNRTGTFGISGVMENYLDVVSESLVAGRFINKFDLENKRKVCVIGKGIQENLFDPDEEPIGERIKVDGIYYTIVGVVRHDGGIGINSPGRTVLLPLTTLQNLKNTDDIHLLACLGGKGTDADVMERKVSALLKELHSIAPDDEGAIWSYNVSNLVSTVDNISIGVNILVWIVGLGALLSGVIGITNIMLVTVRERTREIGVRRALGAKPSDIILQILSESFLLTSIAGFTGMILGISLVQAINNAMQPAPGEQAFLPIFPNITFGIALSTLLLVSVLSIAAGTLPAIRALRVKAIDAIRDE